MSDLAKHLFETANAMNRVAFAGMQSGQAIANLEKPTRAELLIENARLKQTNYELRDAIHRICMEGVCPECGSEDVEHRKVRYPDYSTDKDWDECNACGHEWNEG